MTRPDTQAAQMIVAAARLALAAPPTDDPLQAAKQAAINMGARRAAEINHVGFDTNNPFTPDDLARHTANTTSFQITSLTTGTVYRVMPQRRTGDTFQVEVQVYREGELHKHFYKMTLVRAENGNIRANPGW